FFCLAHARKQDAVARLPSAERKIRFFGMKIPKNGIFFLGFFAGWQDPVTATPSRRRPALADLRTLELSVFFLVLKEHAVVLAY
ncbi:hypothetical protein R0K19_25765, partial [Bacillus sp. SIMBA_161]